MTTSVDERCLGEPNVPPWVDARTGIDMSRWTNDRDILALLDRRIKEINDFSDRLEDAQRRLRAYLVAQKRIPVEMLDGDVA